MTVWGLRKFFIQVKIRDRDDSDSPEGCVGSGASLRAPGILVLFFGKSRGNASQPATNVFASNRLAPA